MSNIPTPSQIRAQQHLTQSTIKHQSLSSMGDVPTGKSRIFKPDDKEVTEEVIKILNHHTPEGVRYKAEIAGDYITGSTEAFTSAIKETKGLGRNT